MPLITTANARDFAAKSHASARLRKQLREAAEIASPPDLQPFPLPTVSPAKPAPVDEYVIKRLIRVRKQLDRIDRMIMAELDPQKIDRLASAQIRLSEQERLLAGRPLPGSRKPSPERRQDPTPTALDGPPADNQTSAPDLNPASACGFHTPTGSVPPPESGHVKPQSVVVCDFQQVTQ